MTIEQNTLDRKIKLIHRATGGLWGGDNINQEFCKFLRNVIGENVFDDFARENASDLLYILGQFESGKRSIRKKSTDDIYVQLPITLYNRYSRTTGKPLDGNTSIQSGKLVISAKECRSFFAQTIRNIVDHLKIILRKPECQDLQYILMVGGFSESPLVIDEMRSCFPDKRVISPVDAGVSVLKGAVLYGWNTEIITARPSPLTYGVSLYDTYNENIHDVSKSVVVGKKRIVLGLFEKIFTINEEINVGTKRSIKVHESYKRKPESLRGTEKEIEIFSSTEPNPRYVTDRNCTRHGRIVVPPPEGGWPEKVRGKVEFEFGGTELMVRFVDRDSNYVVKGNVDFYVSNTHRDLMEGSVKRH